MTKYLVDVNLPYRFSLWKSDEYIHQKDLDDEWTDGQIWNYAGENNLTIITKTSIFQTASFFTSRRRKSFIFVSEI
jgi:predicted nuclease of predicted toxin-antitoxin system